MLNYSYTPNWSDLLRIFQKKNNFYSIIKEKWCSGSKNFIRFFSRSSWIVFLLVCIKTKQKKNEKVVIWLPNYYCSETLYLIKKLNIILCYYEIDKNFFPSENSLKNLSNSTKPDIIIFCHFFGKNRFCSSLKTFSTRFGAWLLEDCTHCISADGNIGKYGDVTFFSPYKFFPMPNGSIMTTSIDFLKKNNLDFFTNENLFNSFLNNSLKLLNFKKKNNNYYIFKWFLKKILTKLYLNFISIQEFSFDQKVNNLNYFNHPKLDFFSINILINYAKKINREKEKRIRMLMLWRHYLSQYPLFKNDNFVLNDDKDMITPYFFLISDLEKNILAKYQFLKKKNIPILTWPSLPNNNKYNFNSAKLFRNSIIFLPLHDQSKDLVKKIKKTNIKEKIFFFKKVSDQKWKDFFNKLNFSNLLQSFEYGESLKASNHLKVRRYLITDNLGNKIAIIQVLEKKLFIFKFIRINRGPILFPDVTEDVLRSLIFSIIEKYKNKFYFLSFSPELLLKFDNIFLKKNFLSIYFKPPAWQSSFLNLSNEISFIEQNLRGNWRNQLRRSIKNNIAVEIDNSQKSIENIIYLNTLDSKIKNYKTIDKKFLKIFLSKTNKIILNALHNNSLIAKICVVLHGSSSTYLIGWSNKQGRELNAINYLLWKAIENLKSNGIKYFDLGGFDRDASESIFSFKSGVGGSEYKLVGKSSFFNNFFFDRFYF